MGKNSEIADIFDRIAEILQFKGENIFRINAYRKAARILREIPGDVGQGVKDGHIAKIEGIGKGMSEKIKEYLSTGEISKYRQVTSDIPGGLLNLLNVPGLGPRTLYLLYRSYGIENLADLEKILGSPDILDIEGMGAKKVENIRKGLRLYKAGLSRVSLGFALPVVEDIIPAITPVALHIAPAGSLRRMKDNVGDIDILASGGNSSKIMDAFTAHPSVKDVLAKGKTKSSVIVESHNLQVDLRVVDDACFGAALQYFTGSQAHNVKLRGMAKSRGLKINEYGVFSIEKAVAGKTEDSVYAALGLPFIPPELREDRGEIEAAAKGNLPMLLKEEDIKGDLHVHSNYSDGTCDIESIAKAAKKRGYSYIGISDHSKSSRIARGLDIDKLKRRNEEIDRMREVNGDIIILKGMEVDVLADGSLDYPDSVLEQLDFVIAAVHQGFSRNVTERMKKAIDNRFVDIIAHPTGRLLSGREGYDVNIQDVMEYARMKGVALEINAYPDRLDLNDNNIFAGKKNNSIFTIGTDSHNTGMFKYLRLGVGIARRGWLTKENVLNAYAWDEMPLRRRGKGEKNAAGNKNRG